MWWCFAGVLPLIIAPNEPVTVAAMVWVIAASIAVSLGAIVGNAGFKTRLRAYTAPATRVEQQVLSWLVVTAIILGLGSSVVFALGSGVALGDLLDIKRLVIVSNQLYVARYAEPDAVVVGPPRLSQALLPFVYLAPALGGVVFVICRKIQWKVVALMSMVPAIAVTILQTTKAAVLFSFSLWFASYLATRLRYGKLGMFTRGHVIVGAALGSIATVFFFAVGLARLASTDTALLEIVRVKLVTAAFGHMSVFSQWLTEYMNGPYSPTLGEFTFAGPRELLGLQQRVPGVFGTVVDLVAGETSNIYTGFRPLIQDFTMPGALAILAILGLVGGIAYRLVALGKWEAVPVLVAAYVTIVWTPITWFWIYNSLTMTVVALALIVWVIRTWRITRGRISVRPPGEGTAKA